MSKKIALVTLTTFLMSTTVAPSVKADWLIDGSGSLIHVEGSILGEETTIRNLDEDRTMQRTEVLDQDDETRLLESRKRQLQLNSQARDRLQSQTEARMREKLRTGDKSSYELSSEEDRQIKLRQELRDNKGRVIKETETEIEGEPLLIEQENGQTIEVRSMGPERLEIVKNKIRTRSEMRLNIGDKNEITVTLPNGKTREVALPDKALEHLVVKGILTPAQGSAGDYVLSAGKNGEPVYQVDGVVEKKLFGLFKLKFEHKLEVAAGSNDDGTVTTGEVVESSSKEVSPWRKLLERFAI